MKQTTPPGIFYQMASGHVADASEGYFSKLPQLLANSKDSIDCPSLAKSHCPPVEHVFQRH